MASHQHPLTPSSNDLWQRVYPTRRSWQDIPRNDLRRLGDLGYEGEANTVTVAFKKPRDTTLNPLQQQFNKAHNSIRAIAERGNALLKTTFKALRNVSLNPWRIGSIVAAALVILHFDHARTT